jgi:hypothetical protein
MTFSLFLVAFGAISFDLVDLNRSLLGSSVDERDRLHVRKEKSEIAGEPRVIDQGDLVPRILEYAHADRRVHFRGSRRHGNLAWGQSDSKVARASADVISGRSRLLRAAQCFHDSNRCE